METERQWPIYFGGNVGEHLDAAIPKADAAELQAAATNVKQYADNHVAHTSIAPVQPTVTLQLAEVHDAMKTLGRLFRRSTALPTCSSFITTTPVEQDDFFAVFRVAWAPPGHNESLARRGPSRPSGSPRACAPLHRGTINPPLGKRPTGSTPRAGSEEPGGRWFNETALRRDQPNAR
jgi:hypothetical protein